MGAPEPALSCRRSAGAVLHSISQIGAQIPINFVCGQNGTDVDFGPEKSVVSRVAIRLPETENRYASDTLNDPRIAVVQTLSAVQFRFTPLCRHGGEAFVAD